MVWECCSVDGALEGVADVGTAVGMAVMGTFVGVSVLGVAAPSFLNTEGDTDG